MSKKILFFGNERLATGITTTAPTFRALCEAGYEIVSLVIAQHELDPSRNRREPEILAVARDQNVPVITATKMHEMAEELQSLGAEAAILVAFGRIVPENIISIFPKGILNIHPSLLPMHRGPTPIESVILHGEDRTGTSIMKLASAMDAGPVFDQRNIDVPAGVSKQELADTLLNLGKDMMIELLPQVLAGTAMPTPQIETDATYDKLITKEESRLDWQKTAQQLAQEVRAFKNWPRSKTSVNGQDLIITKARAVDEPGEIQSPGTLVSTKSCPLGFHTSSGVFVVDSLIPAGKKEMDAAAFAAGYLR